MIADQTGNTEVLHDHTVGGKVIESVKGLDELRQFSVLDQRIDRHIDPFARREGAGVGQQETQSVGGEVVGISARREV